MFISRKILALLAAAALGISLAACQQDAEDKSAASGQGAMDQAPKQGYTGPSSPSTSPPSSPGSSSGQSGDSQSGSPGSTNPSQSQPQPGSQPQDQQQQR